MRFIYYHLAQHYLHSRGRKLDKKRKDVVATGLGQYIIVM